MFGENIGSLKFFINDQVIWKKIGSQEEKWLFTRFSLPDGEYNVLIYTSYFSNLI